MTTKSIPPCDGSQYLSRLLGVCLEYESLNVIAGMYAPL